jgi:hypothetical protein
MELGTEVVLNDNSKYVVIDDFEYEGKEYLYLINRFDHKEACLVRYENDTIHKIDDNIFDKVFEELINRNKEIIIKNLEDVVDSN